LLRHRVERDGRTKDRIKAIILRDRGWSYEEIADALLISEDSAQRYVSEYLKENKLKPENGGSESKLTISQGMELISHLEANTYSKVKNIVFYVKDKYGVEYTISGMTAWLHPRFMRGSRATQ